jgi:hypothetical protein
MGLKATIAWFSDERADAGKAARAPAKLDSAISVGQV